MEIEHIFMRLWEPLTIIIKIVTFIFTWNYLKRNRSNIINADSDRRQPISIFTLLSLNFAMLVLVANDVLCIRFRQVSIIKNLKEWDEELIYLADVDGWRVRWNTQIRRTASVRSEFRLADGRFDIWWWRAFNSGAANFWRSRANAFVTNSVRVKQTLA